MKTTLLFLVTISCALSGCKKESLRPDKSNMLLAHTWRTTAHIQTESYPDDDGYGPFVQNIYAKYRACFRDNTMMFRNDNSLDYNTGATPCWPGESVSGYWYLVKEGSMLLLDDLNPMVGSSAYGGIREYEIVDLTDSTLQLQSSYSYTDGNAQVIITDRYTFSAL